MSAQEEYDNQHEVAHDGKSECVFIKTEPMFLVEHEDGSTGENDNESSEVEIDCNNHPELELFKCEFCNKEFSNNCNLTVHLKLHSDEMISNGQDGDENDNESAEDVTSSNKEIKRFQFISRKRRRANIGRITRDAKRVRLQRLNYGNEEREIRLLKSRERTSLRREKESLVQREARLALDRERHRSRRARIRSKE